jgi:hypothetical protein
MLVYQGKTSKDTDHIPDHPNPNANPDLYLHPTPAFSHAGDLGTLIKLGPNHI